MLEIARLEAPFGVSAGGLDLSKPLEPEVVHELLNALYANRVVVVPGQTLSPAEFGRYGSHFGRPHPHVLSIGRPPFIADHPAILPITNITQDGAEPGYGASHWHTDQSYDEEPSSATLLYALQVPEKGGETLFCDMVAAYDALPEGIASRIEGLVVKHLYGAGVALRADDIPTAPLQTDEQIEAAPMVYHPLVRPHPVTQVKALYSLTGTSRGIVGMSDDEARDLLVQLADHALQPRFCYAHRYEVGDVVVWDTAATLHKAAPSGRATGPENTRFLYRISVKGTPPSLQ
ncbi:MAG: TauD/TfdA family dioxygenase [Myxococcota bacterium]